MLKRLTLGILLILSLAISIFSQNSKIQGYAEQGGVSVVVSGVSSSAKFQTSYPACTITVYNIGTTNLASIYTNSTGTPKSNPFVSDSSGYWFFFGATGSSFDVRFSGTGITTSFTLSGYTAGGGGGGGGTITGSGTTNKVSKWVSSTALGNSLLTDNGTFVQVNLPTVNEGLWSGKGAINILLNGADSSSSAYSSSQNPSMTFQTYRDTGTLNEGNHYYNFASYHKGGGNTYTLNILNYYNPDMTGFPNGEYFQHGLNADVYFNPTNIPAGVILTGYNLLRSERIVSNVNLRIVGAQIETINNASTDAAVDVSAGDFTIGLNVAGGGIHQQTIGIQGEAVIATAFAKFMYVKGDAAFQYLIDNVDALYHPRGTWTFTNGLTTVTGAASPKAIRDLLKGDQITRDGTTWYEVAANPSVDGSFTITRAFAESTVAGQTITKTVKPLRLIRPSWIEGTDGATTIGLIGPTSTLKVGLDKDGVGVYSGSSIIANNRFNNKIMLGSVTDGASDVYPGIWAGATAVATPSATNYIFLYDPFSTNVLFNGGSGVEFRIGNQSKWAVDTNAFYPLATTNTLDFGKSSLTPKDIYVGTYIRYTGLVLANLGTPSNGVTIYCTDCAPNSNPCTATSTGAIAKRLNGAWDCR